MSQALTEKQLAQIKLLGEQAQERILEAQQQEQNKPRPSFIQEGMKEKVKSEAFDASKKIAGLMAGMGVTVPANNPDAQDLTTVAGVYNELEKMFQGCANSGGKQNFDPSELMDNSTENTEEIQKMLQSLSDLESDKDADTEANMGMSLETMASNDDAMEKDVTAKLSDGLDASKSSPSPKPSSSAVDDEEEKQKAKEKADAQDDKEMKEGASQAAQGGSKFAASGGTDVQAGVEALQGAKKAYDAHQRKKNRNKGEDEASIENALSLKPNP